MTKVGAYSILRVYTLMFVKIARMLAFMAQELGSADRFLVT